MAETKTEPKDRNLATVKLDEVAADGRQGQDHQVSAEINYNGLQLNLKVTFDQIREFFTRRGAKKEERKLKAVP